MCTRFYVSPYEVDYRDQGHDYPMTLECQLKYWDMEDDVGSTETFREIMRTAEKCAEYKKVKV